MDAPFKGKLRVGPLFDFRALFDESNITVACGAGTPSGVRWKDDEAKLDHIARCVNAHPKLVEACNGMIDAFNELDSKPETFRKLQCKVIAASNLLTHEALADPAFDPNKAVMDAVAGRAAKDAGIEVSDA